MNNDQSRILWDDRKRYLLSPDRYVEVIAKDAIRRIFADYYKLWRSTRESINYLDLGCGDCRGTRTFANFLKKSSGIETNAFGVDSSHKCETSCKKLGVSFRQADLGSEDIPFVDCQVITLFETIEHIFNTDFLLESIRRSISKGGILLVSTLNVVSWKNRILVPFGIQPLNTEVSTKKLSYGFRFKSLKRRVDFWQPAGHIRPFTLHSLCDILEDNKFTVIKSFGLENWTAFKFLEHLAKNMCSGILVVARPKK